MRRNALLLGLLALVAGAVLLFLRGGTDHGAADIVARDAVEGSPAPARLEGRPDAPGFEAQPSSPAPEARVAETPDRRVTVDLRIRVDQPDAVVEVTAWCPTSRIESVLSPWTVATHEGPGTLRFDVRELVRWIHDRRRRPEIRLRATAPGHVGASIHLALPAADALLAGEAGIDPVDLVLARAALVAGRVVGPDGQPVEGAGVALHLLGSDGPEPESVADWATDEKGGFALATARGGRHLLVASWLDSAPRGPRRVTARPLPATAIVDLVVGETHEVGTLRLRRSHAIRGTVRLEGVPVEGATVQWGLAGDARALWDRGDGGLGHEAWLWWQAGAVHWAADSVQTDARGRFEILGASAVPHRVHVEDALGAHLHRMSKDPSAIEVTPPVRDVKLELRLARLALQARLDGEPIVLEEAVHVSDLGMHPDLPEDVCWGTHFGETDAEGRLEVALTPGHRYAVWIQEPGLATWARPFLAPAAGETLALTVDLEREHPKPRLIAVLEGQGAEGLVVASFGFYEAGADPTSQTPWPIRAATPTDGRFVVEDLVPGRYVMHVRPGRGWHDPPSDWLESVVEVEIPRAGEIEVAVLVGKGGRLLLEVTDVDGRYIECPCTLRGPDGRPVETGFVVPTEFDGLILSDALPGVGPAWVERVLEPGTYELELNAAGYARQVRTVEVREGAPATVRVVLRRP